MAIRYFRAFTVLFNFTILHLVYNNNNNNVYFKSLSYTNVLFKLEMNSSTLQNSNYQTQMMLKGITLGQP